MSIASFTLDFLLIVVAIIAYQARPRIGGALARGLHVLLIGVLILGFAHLIETVMFATLNLDRVTIEIAHRLLIVSAYVFIIWGFVIIRRAFE